MSLTNFPNGILSFGVPVLGSIEGIPFTGNYYFVDPVNGLDGNSGFSPTKALKTLYKAHSLMRDGYNDVSILIGNGNITGTAVLSKALAQSVDSTATTGTLKWTKSAAHLVGVTAPGAFAKRARIAPPATTYTQATFGSGNLVTVSGQGCLFSNFSLFHGFSTGGVNQICWTDTGGRNAYCGIDFGGIGDAASAADTGSRSLKISGTTGENLFTGCTIGLDTVSRGVANASLEFAGGTPRNRFEKCLFPFFASASGVLGILGTGNGCMDRQQFFEDCLFTNAVKSTATTMSVLVSFTTAAPGGCLVFNAGCGRIGITKYGDTNGLANSEVLGTTATADSGTGLNPT